jgi:hypothetical protein
MHSMDDESKIVEVTLFGGKVLVTFADGGLLCLSIVKYASLPLNPMRSLLSRTKKRFQAKAIGCAYGSKRASARGLRHLEATKDSRTPQTPHPVSDETPTAN